MVSNKNNAVSLVTIVIPSFNQGQFLEECISSIFRQNIPVEVYVMDGGSTDNSINIIKKWEAQLTGWRSHTDKGQAAAINEGVALGSAPYIYWLNSDDYLLPDKIQSLIGELENHPEASMAYGCVNNFIESTGRVYPVWVEPFSLSRLAKRCIISQPGVLIRREAWDAVGGLNYHLDMAMDYDLWWRLYQQAGNPIFLEELIAVNRVHKATKTQMHRVKHYREAMAIVKKHHGSIPLKWYLFQPYAVWYKILISKQYGYVDF